MMKLKKALGQNFFNNPTLADWIVEQVRNTLPKSIIEIGPGDGYFTERLLKITQNLTVIEKDSDLTILLAQKFPGLKILNIDILEFNDQLNTLEQPLTVYGSLPYNISKPIIAKFSQMRPIGDMFFIVQKEVAEKYVEKEGRSSIISIMTKLYSDVSILKIIKPGSFIPAPKVDSALIRIVPNRNLESIKDINLFQNIVKTAYRNPRKTLNNNLKPLGVRNVSDELLAKRPGDLSFEDYCGLTNQIVL